MACICLRLSIDLFQKLVVFIFDDSLDMFRVVSWMDLGVKATDLVLYSLIEFMADLISPSRIVLKMASRRHPGKVVRTIDVLFGTLHINTMP